MMESDNEIKAVVRSLVEDRFGDVKISSIQVMRDYDNDGDEILRVTVELAEQTEHLNSRKKAGFLRHLMPKLAERGEQAFPVISFTSDADRAIA